MSAANPSQSLEFLRKLIQFPTVSLQPNTALIEFVQSQFRAHGIESRVVSDDSGTRANLFASVGPDSEQGVLLSGHTDVVPVEGQAWSADPFTAVFRDGKVFGRGAADMKGFLACAMSAMIKAKKMRLSRPLQIAFSYDEEIGCIGVRRLIDVMKAMAVLPYACIVGEPTLMKVGVGHKGKTALNAVCHGLEGHSALAPQAVNAIYLASDLIQAVRQEQDRLVIEGAKDPAYDVPYTTLHVGKIHGGRALNIVPNQCDLAFEIRNLPEDDPLLILEGLRGQAERISAAHRQVFPDARIDIEVVNTYPGLDTPINQDVVKLAGELTRSREHIKVAFGTEGGLFTQRLSVPVVVCGPGSITVAHKPDEYVTEDQIVQCDAFMDGLLSRLAV
jgi:acetylornithine deacetylase